MPDPLPFQYTFASGAIGGVSELLCFYPLDVVKTRQQLATDKTAGILSMLRHIVAQEGPARLYKGILAPILLEAPKRAVKFSSNEFWTKTWKKTGRRVDQSAATLIGCAAGATESFIVTPFELVKIRLQDKASAYKGPGDVVRHIIKTNGVLGMFHGMEATFWRHVFWNAGYFGSIFGIRAQLPAPTSKASKIGNDFIAGTSGGIIGTMLNTPIDVVKSRIQNSQVSRYRWTFPGVFTIARQEGYSALYKGFLPKVLRLGPGGGVLLIVVEFMSGVFRRQLGGSYL